MAAGMASRSFSCMWGRLKRAGCLSDQFIMRRFAHVKQRPELRDWRHAAKAPRSTSAYSRGFVCEKRPCSMIYSVQRTWPRPHITSSGSPTPRAATTMGRAAADAAAAAGSALLLLCAAAPPRPLP